MKQEPTNLQTFILIPSILVMNDSRGIPVMFIMTFTINNVKERFNSDVKNNNCPNLI